MEWFERNPPPPGGGRAASGGCCYHLSFRSGSRTGGACAGAAHAYITRTDEYADPERDAAVYVESDHMPEWAQDDPHAYWDAADLYERANGRLYVSADFALPRGLDADEQRDLAHAFAQELTEDERLPYTLAIHAGLDSEGQEHNPHAHLMMSERQNDGIERAREMWFRRANRAAPDRGGAPKSRTFHGREWIEHARETWARVTNEKLEARGRDERVDHRSYERQGVDREPGHHYGPAAAYMTARGVEHDGFSDSADAAERQDAERAIDQEIVLLEDARAGVRVSVTHDDEEKAEDQSDRGRSSAERPDDTSPSR